MYRKSIFIVIIVMFITGCGENNEITPNFPHDKIPVSRYVINENEITETEKERVKTEDGYLENSYYYDLKNLGLKGEKFYVYENNLPEGLVLDENTGIIMGTAKKEGKYEYKIMLQKDQNPENYQIISFITIILNDIALFKEVRSFIDVSKSANKTEIAANTTIALPRYNGVPFFKYYGSDVENIRVCQQGYIKIGTTACSITGDMNIASPINAIIPFGDPELTMGANSKIYYQIRGSAPNRMIIIQYKNMTRITDTNSSHNFEVVLQEGSNSIQFLYDLSYSVADSGQKHLGLNALVGLSKQGAMPLLVSNAPNPTVEPRSAQIFRGTVISFKAPTGAGQYEIIKDGNVVTDYVNIARISDDSISCNSSTQCTTGLCVNNKCVAANITTIIGGGNGDTGVPINLPFSFYFYGQVFNSVKIHENGFLYFSTPTVNTDTFPTTAITMADINMNNNGQVIPIDYVIAPYYSNIKLNTTKGGNVTYNVLGTAPNRKFIAMYDDVKINTTDGYSHLCSFQVVLHETSNIIEMLYGKSTEDNPSGSQNTKYCNGNQAIVGIKKNNMVKTDILPLNSTTIMNLTNAGKKLPTVGQGKSITFVPNNMQATSYTWVGLNNIVNNAEDTNTQSSFEATLGGWTELSDLGMFLRYDVGLVSESWIDTTNATILHLTDDDSSGFHIESEAIYKFYDQKYMDFWIQSNGGVTFNSEWVHYIEPSTLGYTAQNNSWPDKGIWVYWNDLDPGVGGIVRTSEYSKTRTDGTVHNVLVVEWNAVPTYYNGSSGIGSNTLQMQLWDDGDIIACYDGVYLDRWNNWYLSGLRNSNIQYVTNPYNINTLISSNQCIKYTPVYSAGGNAVRSTASGTDDGIQLVSLPFDFNFRGRIYSQLTISANGAVAFGNVPIIPFDNSNLNTATIPNDFLPVFWDDLDTRARNIYRAGIFYGTFGTSPNRKFIVSYNDAAHYEMDPSYINAQVILSEGSNEIKYCYGTLRVFGLGSSATVGIRESSSTYVQLSYNQVGIIQPNTCFTYIPPVAGYVPARNIYEGEMNTDFYDISLKAPVLFNEEIKDLYVSDINGQDIISTYAIFDLLSQGYPFIFKGRMYDKLFITGNGAVSFGNNDSASIITGPMWQNVFYNNEITNHSHPSLVSPYSNNSQLKPTTYSAGIIKELISPTKCSRRLVVQWNNVRLAQDKSIQTDNRNTEANFQMIFDNGDYYNVHCDNITSSTPLIQGNGKYEIKFVYGSMSGNDYNLKTGAFSAIVLRSLFSNYSQTFGSNDAGTVNSGSSFIIKGE